MPSALFDPEPAAKRGAAPPPLAGKKRSGPISRNGPQRASQKLDLAPFSRFTLTRRAEPGITFESRHRSSGALLPAGFTPFARMGIPRAGSPRLQLGEAAAVRREDSSLADLNQPLPFQERLLGQPIARREGENHGPARCIAIRDCAVRPCNMVEPQVPQDVAFVLAVSPIARASVRASSKHAVKRTQRCRSPAAYGDAEDSAVAVVPP